MTGDNLVQPLAVSRHDVLHIAHILQPSFNLERAGSCLDEFLKIVYAAHVTERKQVALVLYDVAFTILQVELQAAELCAGTSVGAASETMLRGIADAGIAHAEGSVDEDLQFHVGHLAMNLGYLRSGQLTCEDDTAETQRAQPAHLLCRAVVGLGRSVEGSPLQRANFTPSHYGDGPGGGYSHVLYEEGISPYPLELFHEPSGVFQLVIVDDGVDGNIDFGTKLMGIAT